jgi:hypothetical protein
MTLNATARPANRYRNAPPMSAPMLASSAVRPAISSQVRAWVAKRMDVMLILSSSRFAEAPGRRSQRESRFAGLIAPVPHWSVPGHPVSDGDVHELLAAAADVGRILRTSLIPCYIRRRLTRSRRRFVVLAGRGPWLSGPWSGLVGAEVANPRRLSLSMRSHRESSLTPRRPVAVVGRRSRPNRQPRGCRRRAHDGGGVRAT